MITIYKNKYSSGFTTRFWFNNACIVCSDKFKIIFDFTNIRFYIAHCNPEFVYGEQ